MNEVCEDIWNYIESGGDLSELVARFGTTDVIFALVLEIIRLREAK